MFKNLNRTAFTKAIALAALALACTQTSRAQTPVQAAASASAPGAAQSGATTPAQTPAPAATPAQLPPTGMQHTADGHEYAPLLEQKMSYKDWTFKSLKDGSPVDLRDLLKNKKLVAVVYFAPWCPN